MTQKLRTFLEAEQPTFDLARAIARAERALQDPIVEADQVSKPGPGRKLTKIDGHTSEVVSLYPGEHLELRRW